MFLSFSQTVIVIFKEPNQKYATSKKANVCVKKAMVDHGVINVCPAGTITPTVFNVTVQLLAATRRHATLWANAHV